MIFLRWWLEMRGEGLPERIAKAVVIVCCGIVLGILLWQAILTALTWEL